MKTLLFILICFVALTAFSCGLIMVSNPGEKVLGLALDVLNPTPFKNFMVPGIFLTLVGTVNLTAAFFNLQRSANRYNWAIAGGVMITGWIIVQMILIQTLYWLQFIYLGAGLLIILIAYQLKGKWAV
jgi:hypothetical protein